jgi:hypothetical protein
MFRLLRLRPPNGWNAVGWELAIVTLGVLLALGAQQWADGREWHTKATDATKSLRDEVALHYAWSIEWRMVEPCIVAQIDRLQERILASGEQLTPAPVYSEPGIRNFVIRLPSKEYSSNVWTATINDGVSPHLDPAIRRELSAHYVQANFLVDMTDRNNVDNQRLLSLSRPLPLDPTVRYSLLQELDELRGRVEFMGLLSGQMIDHVIKAGMVPPTNQTRDLLSKYGTVRFCRAHGFPTRSQAEAATPVPN